MIKLILLIIIAVAILYILKVPIIVDWITTYISMIASYWNPLIDEWTHLAERHRTTYLLLMSLLAYLVFVSGRNAES